MAEVLSKQDVQDVIEVIKQLYFEDRIPWICGYSGGKDSTAIVQLVWMALRQIPKEKRVKTVHVISTDMARLDSAHRYNFINRYLPNASSQVIVLSTDEEVNGQYLEQLREHIGTYYTLKYDEVAKSTSILPGYFGEVLA